MSDGSKLPSVLVHCSSTTIIVTASHELTRVGQFPVIVLDWQDITGVATIHFCFTSSMNWKGYSGFGFGDDVQIIGTTDTKSWCN